MRCGDTGSAGPTAPGRQRLNSQALAAPGAAGVQDGAAAPVAMRTRETMGTGALGLGGLVGAFHDGSCSGAPWSARGLVTVYEKPPIITKTARKTNPLCCCGNSHHGSRALSRLVDNSAKALQSSPRHSACRSFQCFPPPSLHEPAQPAARSVRPVACVHRRLAQEIPEQQFNTWIPAAERARVRQRRQGHAGGGQPLQDGLDPRPVRRQDHGRAGSRRRPAGGARVTLAPREQRSARRCRPPAAARPASSRRCSPSCPWPLRPSPKVETHNHRLNTALTFATLVEGSANRMARAAAMHVAGNLACSTTRSSSTAAWASARPT